MPRYTFPAGTVTNATGAPLRLTFHSTSTTSRRETDLSTIDSSGNLVERIPNGVILTDSASPGAYSAFAGPDDVSTLYLQIGPTSSSRTAITATGIVAGSDGEVGSDAVRYPLPRAYKKISSITGGTAGRFKVLLFGDSYAAKVGGPLYSTLQPLLGGIAGGYGCDSQITALTGMGVISATSGSVTVNTTDFDAWPSGVTRTLATSASVTWQATYGTATCDTFKVYYVKEPGAGTFKIQVDGSDAAGFTNVSAVGTLGSLGIATVSVTRGSHNVSVVNLTGTVRVILAGYEDSTKSGICALACAQSGKALNQPLSTAWSNFQDFLTDTSPDLMLFEMKEQSTYSDGTTYAQALASLFTVTTAGASGMDVIGIGSPPVSTSDADQVAQNATLKAACARYGYVYYDTYAIYGSYARLTALGWNGDGTHVATACDEHRTSLLMRDTGLTNLYGRGFATGTPKVSKIQFAQTSNPSGGTTSVNGTAEHNIQATLFDLSVNPARFMSVFATDGTTEILRMDARTSGGPKSFFLNGMRVASTSGGGIWSGTGSPEAAFTAPAGSIFLRTDGGAGTSFYVKESGSGNTGWIAK